MATSTHVLLPIFPEESWVREWIRIRVGYVWTGKFDLNTDTWGRGKFLIWKEKVADSKISGYLWTESKNFIPAPAALVCCLKPRKIHGYYKKSWPGLFWNSCLLYCIVSVNLARFKRQTSAATVKIIGSFGNFNKWTPFFLSSKCTKRSITKRCITKQLNHVRDNYEHLTSQGTCVTKENITK